MSKLSAGRSARALVRTCLIVLAAALPLAGALAVGGERLDLIEAQAYLKAAVVGQDAFGYAVALDGDTLVVGAPDESSSATGVDGDAEDDSLASAGAVYVFIRTGMTWRQQAYLKASNPGADDQFGWSVAIRGDTLVVGARGEASSAGGVDPGAAAEADDSAAGAGAAYVFTRSGQAWSQQAYLKASNAEAGDQFGYAVATDGASVVVGAIFEAGGSSGVNGDELDDSQRRAGAAYVFARADDAWTQQAYLKASNTGSGDFFGYAVAVDGDTVAVGAGREDSSAVGVNGDDSDNETPGSGAAYVFTRATTTWTQQAFLKASDPDVGDLFGEALALDGDTLVVGAQNEDGGGTGVVGDDADDTVIDSGAAYVFVRSDSTWRQEAYLKASNTGAGDLFGWSVAIDEHAIVVSAFSEAGGARGVNGNGLDDSVPSAGAAYLFERTDDSWQPGAYLKATNTEERDFFGSAVAISGDVVAVGAEAEDGGAPGVDGDQDDNSFILSGAVYVYGVPAEPAFPGERLFVDGFEALPPLLHRWSFDGSVEDSVGGVDAVLVGGVLEEDRVTLDGVDDHVELPIAATFSTLESVTIEAWLTLDSIANWVRIFDFGNDTEVNFFATARAISGEARSAITRESVSGEQQVSALSALPVGTRVHVAVTLDGELERAGLYVNGRLVGTEAWTLTPAALGALSNHWLGRSHYPDPFLHGSYDEFRIHGRALGSGQIRASCAAGPDVLLEESGER